MLDTPFFIVGCSRSGTTLLKSILSAHPELFVMPETFFFSNVYPNIARNEAKPWRAASGWWLADAGITPDRIKQLIEARLEDGCSRECAVLKSIFDFHSEKHRGKKIGEKTPDHVNYISEIRECFPGARVIQIVRDPRAVASSFRKVKVGSNAIADIVDEWRGTEQILESNTGSDGFFSLRYEDLVTSPEENLREVCAFLGVKWTKRVLKFYSRNDDGFAPEQVHHANTRKPLFYDSIDNWRQELTSREVGLVEWALGDGMQRQGYSLAGDSPVFPILQMRLSRLAGCAHKIFVRAPRQRMKAFRARRRLAQKGARE